MKIDKAEALWVKMPLKFPFETSYGRETHVQTVLVRLYSEGLAGWGEAATSSFPDYCYETPSVALLALEKYFFPAVVGKDFDDPAALAASGSTVVVPGEVESSVLFELISLPEDDFDRMPPEGAGQCRTGPGCRSRKPTSCYHWCCTVPYEPAFRATRGRRLRCGWTGTGLPVARSAAAPGHSS